MPNETNENGIVKVVDNCPLEANVSLSIGSTSMWYAKLFGHLWHSKQIASKKGIIDYVNDMDPVEFNLDSVDEENEMMLTISLDHTGYVTLKKKKSLDLSICDG